MTDKKLQKILSDTTQLISQKEFNQYIHEFINNKLIE
jgi:hypothetical protein